MRMIDVDAIPENEMNYPVWVCLRKQPTIDAVPVVRCRECKHGRRGVDNIVICFHPCGKAISMTAGDFCSYGQRKETANE